MELNVVDKSELPARAAEKIAELVRAAAEARGRACVALAGGTTPRAVHEVLATRTDIPWPRVHIFFGDERCVPPDDPESNYRMAKESLLARIPITEEQIHRPRAEDANHDAVARAYEAELPAEFDVVMLGIGEDGHTASLFPRSPALNERNRRYIPVVGPKPPPQRLSLTVPALEQARELVMFAVGSGKAEAVARALEGAWDPFTMPSQLARRGVWFVDRAGAALLQGPHAH